MASVLTKIGINWKYHRLPTDDYYTTFSGSGWLGGWKLVGRCISNTPSVPTSWIEWRYLDLLSLDDLGYTNAFWKDLKEKVEKKYSQQKEFCKTNGIIL
jgi:hypothetical protein